MDILKLIGRDKELFNEDIKKYESELQKIISNSSFLVIGGAGTIGSATAKEIFKRNPKKLHIVDISENNLVEVVRDLRSSLGYIDGEFKTFALDAGSDIYDSFIKTQKYDYILNFSALKHVRSEKDIFTLMRMIEVNILNTEKTLLQSIQNNTKKYFCVSTDKATNPVNMMGASKRIMELFLMRRSLQIDVSTARFANVAFSDGSLLHSFNERLEKNQPIVAPNDIKRYFVTPKESGELCLMSTIFGENRDIFFPKLSEDLHLISFADIAVNYLKMKGYEPYICKSEAEAREFFLNPQPSTLNSQLKYWPCLFTKSDTTGEKDFEEFYTDTNIIDWDKFSGIGVIKNQAEFNNQKLEYFLYIIKNLRKNGEWNKKEIVELFEYMLPEFTHLEKGKYLDEKM